MAPARGFSLAAILGWFAAASSGAVEPPAGFVPVQPKTLNDGWFVEAQAHPAKTSGRLAIWGHLNPSESLARDVAFDYMRQLWELDCRAQTAGTKAIALYKIDGKLIKFTEFEDVAMIPAGRNRFTAFLLHQACKGQP